MSSSKQIACLSNSYLHSLITKMIFIPQPMEAQNHVLSPCKHFSTQKTIYNKPMSLKCYYSTQTWLADDQIYYFVSGSVNSWRRKQRLWYFEKRFRPLQLKLKDIEKCDSNLWNQGNMAVTQSNDIILCNRYKVM